MIEDDLVVVVDVVKERQWAEVQRCRRRSAR
jgi:hypothetical protein